MTQSELAGTMGVTPSTVTGWETGKSSPNFQVLLRLREHFQVDLERLVYQDLQKETTKEAYGHSLAGDNLRVVELLEQLKDRMDDLERRLKNVEGK